MSDLQFTVQGVSKTPTKLVATAREFNLIVDEPPELGGTNEGANPVEYLLAGYAGCLNVVGHMVAKELDFRLEKLEIQVSGCLNPERLLGTSFTERAGFKQIEVILKATANASPDLLKKWSEVVENRCPVNDNLKDKTPVSLRVWSI